MIVSLPAVTFDLRLRLDPTAFEEWELAKRRFSDEVDAQQTDQDLLQELLRVYLATNADGSVPGRRPVRESHYKIVLRCEPADGQAHLATEHGPVLLPAARASMLACEGAIVEAEPGTPVAEALAKAPPTDERLRRRILARDRHRCRCCGTARQVQVHHKVWREHGGLTVPSNLLALCVRCHALIHAGYLIVVGEVEGELRFLDMHERPIDRRVIVAPVPNAQFAPTPPVQVLCFTDVPARVDAAWWQGHRHLLEWNERRGVLSFREGVAASERELAARNSAEEPCGSDDPLRPTCLAEVVGQTRVVSALTVAIAAAKREQRPLPHVLLAGPAGVGKTTLARAVAHELDGRLQALAAPLLDEVPKLVAALVALSPGDVLLLDEVHALPRAVGEVLYEALEDRTLSLPLVCGNERRTLVVELPPFTCIGATTDEGSLAEPLRARFPLRECLQRPSDAEVAETLRRASMRAGLPLTGGAARVLAGVAGGVPRDALALLGRARDERVARGGDVIDEDCARAALVRAGIDGGGLGPVERAILELLRDGRPRALAQVAAHVGLPPATVVRLHEPPLLRSGLLRITARGRVGDGGGRARVTGRTPRRGLGTTVRRHCSAWSTEHARPTRTAEVPFTRSPARGRVASGVVRVSA